VSDPVDPIRRLDRLSRVRRVAAGSAGAASAGKPSPSRAVVPAGPARTHDREPAPDSGRATVDAAFAAQLLAGAPRRGLKGGPEMLEQARTTYLKNEYSGPADRRARKGRGTKTDV
jgi:hypothetical protein